MKRRLINFSVVLALPALSAYSQTSPPCAERDYSCQLEAAMKALKADPKNPENYYNIGLVFQRSGDHKNAVDTFSMYVAIPGLKPELLADGYNNRGVSHRKLGRADLAVADYTKAFELVPTSAKFLTNRANAHLDLKKYDAALADYTAAIKLDPKFAPAYSARGAFYGSTSRPAEAAADFTKAIELAPADPENFYNRGLMYGDKGEHARSITDFDRYILMQSGNPAYLADGYANRGVANMILGRDQEALADFTKVIDLDPKRVNGYKGRAMVYRRLKKDDLAAADEKKVAELSKP